MVLIAQLVVGEGLEGYAQAVVILSHQHGQPPQPVPGGDDGVGGQQQDGAGAVDDLLGVADALDQAARWLMRAAVSSVVLILPEDMAMN